MSEETISNSSWRRYPHLDAALEVRSPALLATMENTRDAIECLCRTGSPRETERARIALLAYARTFELYHHLVELRDEALRTSSNMRTGTAINQ